MNIFKKEIAYLKDNPKGLWFKRKLYGYGWTPARPEGWLVVLVYVVAIVRIFMYVDSTSHSGSDTLIAFAVPFIILTVTLIVICYKKGEKPRWQWGQYDT